MHEQSWLHCPICRGKTRLKIREDTVLVNFPLYCPKCRKEILIRVQRKNITIIIEPVAEAQSR